MFGISVLIFTLIFPHNVFAQTLHNQTLEEITKQKVVLDSIPQMDIGSRPGYMDIDVDAGRIYVSRPDSNTISIISTENNTKIKDIEVGESPDVIKTFYFSGNNRDAGGNIVVANSESGTISVISNDTKIKDIKVGERPIDIEIFSFSNETNDTEINKIYVANFDSNTISVMSADNYTKIKDIKVGENPTDLEIFSFYNETNDTEINKIYVANFNSSTISVISPDNDIKIKEIEVGEYPGNIEYAGNRVYVTQRASGNLSVISPDNDIKIKEIEVGDGPRDIETVPFYNETSETLIDKVYVANSESDTVSVVSGDTKIKDIEVGEWPIDIEIFSFYNETNDTLFDNVYVANAESGTISVISNDTKIKDIKVGERPRNIRVDEQSNTIYVSNSEGITVIDGETNKVVARVSFTLSPSNAGQIICNGITSPLNRYFYVSADTECVAKPNKGFEFSSWAENSDDNSTRTIKTSTNTSILESFLDFLNIKPNDPTATLNNTQFGNFTANFNKLPPPIPSEYLIPLYGIIITTIVGWSIPSLIGWFRAKMDSRRIESISCKNCFSI